MTKTTIETMTKTQMLQAIRKKCADGSNVAEAIQCVCSPTLQPVVRKNL